MRRFYAWIYGNHVQFYRQRGKTKDAWSMWWQHTYDCPIKAVTAKHYYETTGKIL